MTAINCLEGDMPRSGWKFKDKRQMEKDIKEFTRNRGYEAKIRSSTTKTVYWVCSKFKTNCQVKWTVGIEPGSGVWVVRPYKKAVHSHALAPNELGGAINSTDKDKKPQEGSGRSGQEGEHDNGATGSVDLVWIGVPEDNKPIFSDTFVGIPFETNNPSAPAKLLPLHKAASLAESLGPAFVASAEDPTVLWIHQSLATILLATDNVQAKNWDDLDDGSLSSLFEGVRLDQRTIVLVARTAYPATDSMSLAAFYDRMRVICSIYPSIELYPSYDEVMCDELKVGDIRAFDWVAERSPPEFSFRPKTCFGHGPCVLANLGSQARMVVKRAFSCGGMHVHVVQSSQRENLSCTLANSHDSRRRPRRRHPQRQRPRPGPCHSRETEHWFHQEFVATLLEFGEFRVFIRATGSGTNGAEIISIAHTRPNDADLSSLFVQTFRPDLFAFLNAPSQIAKADELHRFALHQYAELRRSPDAARHFGSLSVGVRLDIGISDLTAQGRFFVVEATRWPFACYFSAEYMSRPYTWTAEAFAEAFQAYLKGRSLRGV